MEPQGGLGYIFDRDAQVTVLDLKFGKSLLFCVYHLLGFFWFLNFCVTFFGPQIRDRGAGGAVKPPQ